MKGSGQLVVLVVSVAIDWLFLFSCYSLLPFVSCNRFVFYTYKTSKCSKSLKRPFGRYSIRFLAMLLKKNPKCLDKKTLLCHTIKKTETTV